MEHRPKSTHVRAKAFSTMAESLMLDHKVTSQSRPESLIFSGPPATTRLQTLNDWNTTAVGTKEIDDIKAKEAPACSRRRVSLTLSEYFASDFSPSSVAPGDYGWFTPCTSGPLIHNISSSPRPVRYKGRSLTFSNAHGSTKNTASLSSSSLADRTASRDAMLNKGSDLSLYTRGVNGVIPEEGQLAPARTGGAASAAAVHTLPATEKFGDLNSKPQSRHETPVGADHRSSVRGRIASKGAGASATEKFGDLYSKPQSRHEAPASAGHSSSVRRSIASRGAGASATENFGNLYSKPQSQNGAPAGADHSSSVRRSIASRGAEASATETFGDLYSKPQSQHETPAGADHISSVRRTIASRGAGAFSSISRVPAGSALQGAVFPVARTMTSRVTEINQWHSQHRDVSCSGPMDVSSRGKGSGSICTMYTRRPSFAVSARHFPEKPVQSQVVHTTRLEEGYAWALTEIRVVKGAAPWDPARAEYLVVASLGRGKLVAGWRRASDFKGLANVARKASMSKACEAWETLEQARRLDGGGPCNLPLVMRPRRLDTVYLHNKARFLEHFLGQFVLELSSMDALVTFLDPSLPYTVEI